MERSDRLVKSEMIDKANESISVLEKNIDDLSYTNEFWFRVISDDTITGRFGNKVMEHLLSLITLNSSFSNLLQLDVQDYNSLISLLDSNITKSKDMCLDGATILDGINNYEAEVRHSQAGLDAIKEDYDNLPGWRKVTDWAGYNLARLYLEDELDGYKDILKDFRRQRDLFDSVQSSSSSLFVQNNDLRNVIRIGYTELPKEWHNNGCYPSYTCIDAHSDGSWKTRLQTINDDKTNQYVSELYFFRTGLDRSRNDIEINWDNVEKLIHSDPKSINPYQYMALASLYSYLSDEDMNNLFRLADEKDKNNYHTISKAFGTSLYYYNLLTVNTVDPATWVNNNDVIRSTALLTTYNYINGTNGMGDKYYVYFTSERTPDNIIKQYKVKIEFVEKEKTFWESLLDALGGGPSPEQMLGEQLYRQGKWADFTISRNVYGIQFDNEADKITTAYIDGMGGSWGQFSKDQITGFVIGNIPGLKYIKEIPGISIPFTLGTFLYDAADQHATRSDANAAISLVHLGNMFYVASAGGNIVNGDYNLFAIGKSDTVTVTNINVNETALAERVNAYNEKHPNNRLSFDSVLSGFYECLSGNTDLSLLDNYASTNNQFITFYRDYMDHPETYANCK